MRVPVSWLVEHVALPSTGPDADAIAEALIRIGFEVEDVLPLPTSRGPLVAGRVVSVEELTEFKKPIRYCRVDVGGRRSVGGSTPIGELDPDTAAEHNDPPDGSRGIVCGATNFAEGDLVVVALPGAVLPGDFEIAARTTYGHVSDGMICALDELGLGDDHSGILVLPPGTASPGDDAYALLGLDDTVLEIAITPDRGYALSIRGLARELACAFGVPYGDPAAADLGLGGSGESGHPVRLEAESGCQRFVARTITALDPTAPSPWWMRRRLLLCGIRPISLAVDVTNYVMIELGQPMHAYDAATLTGDIVVRRASKDEKITTLDDQQRSLDPDDVVVADHSGPIGLAGVMGGASTEVGDTTSDVLLEAATWDPASVARTARRHKLPSEAARRFERVTDPAVNRAAIDRAAWLLREYGGAEIDDAVSDEGGIPRIGAIAMELDLPDRVAGVRYERGVTAHRLGQVGCTVEVVTAGAGTGGAVLSVTPPTWRSDLTRPADLVEEVLRLEGYATIPSVLPAAAPGTGLTLAQRRRRQVTRSLADAGYQEVLPSPFVSPTVLDALGLDADDPRRRAVRLANPLDADRSLMATTLLPGLFDAVTRNVSRGLRDLALFQVAQVVRPDSDPDAMPPPVAPPLVDARPADSEVAALLAALPGQPQRVAAVLTGAWERRGWWGPGRDATWSDAIDAARVVCEVYGVTPEVAADVHAPWHPGRCAVLTLPGTDDAPATVLGHAGELHPKVIEALGLPARTAAMELELDRIPLEEPRPAPRISSFPPVLLDVALVAGTDVPAASLAAALREGGGELVEDVRLFDIYQGPQVGDGRRGLTYSFRVRAPDRTLTLEEASAIRDAAVSAASERHGASLRT